MSGSHATVTQDDMMLVRLKPFNPRRKQLLRTFTYKGYRFLEARGWHQVPSWLAAELKEIPQIESDPTSPFAFDVCTMAEAVRIDDAEDHSRRMEYERRLARDTAPTERRGAISARAAGKLNTVTTQDLPSTRASRYVEEADGDAAERRIKATPRHAELPEDDGTMTTRDLPRSTRAADDGEGEDVMESPEFDKMMKDAGVQDASPEPKPAPEARPLPSTIPKGTRKRGPNKSAGSARNPSKPTETDKEPAGA